MTKTAAVAYQVRWRKNSDPANQWSSFVTVGGDGHVTVPGLERVTDYTFEARAISGCGAKSAWATQLFTMPGPPDGTITLQELTGDVIADIDFDSGDLFDRAGAVWTLNTETATSTPSGSDFTGPQVLSTPSKEGSALVCLPDTAGVAYSVFGTGNIVLPLGSNAFGTDVDFCIEMYCRLNINSTSGSGACLFGFYLNSTTKHWLVLCRGTSLEFDDTSGLTLIENNPFSFIPGDWPHIAMSRLGDILTLWFNGAIAQQYSNASALYIDPDYSIVVGNDGLYADTATAYSWRGQIDNIRVTRNWARYTQPFTPPSVPYKRLG